MHVEPASAARHTAPPPRSVIHGHRRYPPRDSWIAAVMFGEAARACALMSDGNATQPGPPHHGDQLPLSAKGERRPVWRTRAKIEANLEIRAVVGPTV